MKKNYSIGIDVSKKTLDICLVAGEETLAEVRIANRVRTISSTLRRLMSRFGVCAEDLVVCAEYTGPYTYPLRVACLGDGIALCLENPLQIKLSIGLTRGKNDKVDARRIARYAERFRPALRLCQAPDEALERLTRLETMRKEQTREIAKYKAQLSEMRGFTDRRYYATDSGRYKRLLAEHERALREITAEMEGIIKADAWLTRQMGLLTGIAGVGKVVAMNMIVVTRAFTRFDNVRQFNCYAGLAPFAYTSGTSQRSRCKVSHMANKDIKTLLHLAALSVIRTRKSDLKDYYLRKVAEGKNKMTVINALRAKLAARMFSVVRNDRPYKPFLTMEGLHES